MKTGVASPRLAAWSILDRLFTHPERRVFLDREYSSWIRRERYVQQDRALLVGLVRGVVKHHRQLGLITGEYVHQMDSIPWAVRIILSMGIYQLARMTRIPAYAVVNESVKLALQSGFKGFCPLVNAVLRTVTRHRDRLVDSAERWGMDLPSWLEREWGERLGRDSLEQLKVSLARPPILTLRPARLGESRQALAKRLAARGIAVEADPLSPHALRTSVDYTVMSNALDDFEESCYVQDSGSLVVVDVLNPKPGETIVEIGAGSGGKTLNIARLMNNRGQIVAIDVNQNKLHTLIRHAQQAGIDIISTQCADIQELDAKKISSADRVMVDAPCSGLGTLRRNPEIALAVSQAELDALGERQLQMLTRASNVVKTGGVLVYCVCTLTRKETSEVVEAFETIAGDLFQRVPVQGISWKEPAGSKTIGETMLELWPHRYDSDGFFIATWRKKWPSKKQA